MERELGAASNNAQSHLSRTSVELADEPRAKLENGAVVEERLAVDFEKQVTFLKPRLFEEASVLDGID